MGSHDKTIERVRDELGPEAAEIADGMLRRRADNRVRALARKIGLRVRSKNGRYTILGAFNDKVLLEDATAATAVQWLKEFYDA
jgi:hypothetical protein